MEMDRDKKSNVSFTHPSTVSLLNGPSRDIITKLSGTIGILPRREKDSWGGEKEVEITTRMYPIYLQIIIDSHLILKNRIIRVKPLAVPNETLFPQTTNAGY